MWKDLQNKKDKQKLWENREKLNIVLYNCINIIIK